MAAGVSNWGSEVCLYPVLPDSVVMGAPPALSPAPTRAAGVSDKAAGVSYKGSEVYLYPVLADSLAMDASVDSNMQFPDRQPDSLAMDTPLALTPVSATAAEVVNVAVEPEVVADSLLAALDAVIETPAKTRREPPSSSWEELVGLSKGTRRRLK